ncbi:M16 family metallopeptidase [Arvimicrobium flavum]|uniref:M16 family metallopeptidase n=1 Tax=Arvimicrobium flavum TaxID=3393320 RepID=UPI00237BEB7C|nr:pitrilysin family protein [Mesorhizobium shangrilense]
MKRFFFAFFMLVSLASIGAASDDKPLETTRYTLENGLQVVLAPDRRVPKVVMNLRYRVGSMNEPAGRSGFAHLFEHLMFSGTPAWPNVFAAQAAMGNTINAWTQEDGTVYYAEGLSCGLPVILSIEADRMANLGEDVDQRELDLQRNVVKNEMRQNVLDNAGSAGWTAFWSGLFPDSHPYSRAVIGSIADLDDASLDEVRGFFDTYYVPNNAILVLVGDFAVEDAKALIEDTFGRIPTGAEVPRPSPAPTAPTKLRLDVTDRVATASVAIGFDGPPSSSDDNGDLAIASDLLGNGAFGLLRSRLVAEKGLANSVGASWTPGLLGGRFEIDATVNEGVAVETLETELRAAFEEFLSTPIDPADVARSKSTALLSAKLAIEPFDDRASAIAYATDILGDPGLALEDDRQIVAATAESVAATARKVLDLKNASTLIVRPGKRGDYPAILLESSGVPAPFQVAERPHVDVPKLEAREPGATKLPEKTTATLSNGVKVVHYQLPETPMEYVAAVAPGGWLNAPEGKEGLIDVAANMAVRGAGDRSYAALAKTAADIGANIASASGNARTAMSMAVPKGEFANGLALLADVIQRPRFDEGEWKILTTDYAQWLANRESDLPGVAARSANAVLFPKEPGRPDQDWSLDALRAMTLDDARNAFLRLFQPSTTTFYSVGSQPVEEVAQALERAFAGWKDVEAGYTALQFPSATFPAGRKVLLAPERGASQSALFIARPAPGREDPQRAEATAVMRLLGDDFNGRLNSVIREEKGYTYGTSARLMSAMKSHGGMVVEMTVGRDNTGAALKEVFKGFDSLATSAVSEEELNRTITAYRTALAATAETGRSFAGYVIDTGTLGVTLEEDHARRERVAALELDAVRKVAPDLASLTPSVIVVAGDPDVVLPQLAAIGITDVEVIQRRHVGEPAMRDAVETGGAEDADTPQPGGLPRGAGSTQPMQGCGPGTGADCPPAETGN